MKFRHLDAVDGLPTQSKVEQKLLRFLYRFPNGRTAQQVYGPLADAFNLTSRQRHALLQSGEERAWENRVRQARRRLVEQGLLNNTTRDRWILTIQGRREAEWLEETGEREVRKRVIIHPGFEW